MFGFNYIYNDFGTLREHKSNGRIKTGDDDYVYSDEFFDVRNPFTFIALIDRINHAIYDLILRIDNEVSRMADEVYSQVISNISTQHTENDLFNFIHTNGNNLIGGVLGEAVPTAKDPKKRQYERLTELPDSEYAYIKK